LFWIHFNLSDRFHIFIFDHDAKRFRCDALRQAFEIPPFKTDYNAAFRQITNILQRYGIIQNTRNLRFRFTLCMQLFFDSLPRERWKIKDPVFIIQSEEFAIIKFNDWIIEHIS
jgi:hypothetical protein